MLKETPALIDRLTTELRRTNLGGARERVAELRARHPKATDSEILNYLITGYCPAVSRRADLSEAQKKAEMDRVSGALRKLLFTPGSP